MKILPLKHHTKSWVETSDCVITDCPNDADFIIYEEKGDPVHEISQIKKQYEEFQRKLVFILSGDRDFSDDISIWFCMSIVPNQINKIQIYGHNPRILNIKPQSHPKNIKGCFWGTLWNTSERQCLKTLSKDWIVNEVNWWRLNSNKQTEVSTAMYDMMKKSYYTLCPKGKGSSSMRIIESLACGSIPILINDDSNPFGENYGDLPIRISKEEIPHINNLLDDLPIPDESRLQDCLKFYKENIYDNANKIWSVSNGFTNKIISILNNICNGQN